MAAPKKNQFWKLRAKHGRDKIFETPEALWECAEEYFTVTTERKWVEQHWVGKDRNAVDKNHPTPFTISGLCIFLDVNTQYFTDFKKGLQGKEDKTSKDFSFIITRIENIIYTQKFEGATTGFFNQNIIARDLGLVDKKDLGSSDGTMSPKPTIVNVSDKKIDIDHITGG